MDPEIRRLAEDYVRAGTNRRAAAAVQIMLEKGSVTTDDLSRLGYNHPPRAIGDVRDAGIPVVSEMKRSETTGRSMASYSLGSFKDVVNGRIGGRSALPKALKLELIAKQGLRDGLTGAPTPAQALQIDHRIPFRIVGDKGLSDRDLSAFMLLDGQSQRSKSWSCENCRNGKELLDPTICKRCYWAYPENYDHIAMEPVRRTDVTWQGADVDIHDQLRAKANNLGITVAEYLRRLARDAS